MNTTKGQGRLDNTTGRTTTTHNHHHTQVIVEHQPPRAVRGPAEEDGEEEVVGGLEKCVCRRVKGPIGVGCEKNTTKSQGPAENTNGKQHHTQPPQKSGRKSTDQGGWLGRPPQRRRRKRHKARECESECGEEWWDQEVKEEVSEHNQGPGTAG